MLAYQRNLAREERWMLQEERKVGVASRGSVVDHVI